MWTPFFLENIHFAINVFAGLVFFAVFWLYLDAWLVKREFGAFLKIGGFLLISNSFLIQAIILESAILPSPLFNRDILIFGFGLVRLAGYLFLFIAVLGEPIPVKPKTTNAYHSDSVVGFFGLPATVVQFAYPVFAALIGAIYWRKSGQGLERHLRQVGVSFLLLAFAELLFLASLMRGTNNASIFKIVEPFGSVWILHHILLFVTCLVLGRWVWGYLLKRLITQLFMIFTLAALAIFLITTVCFTALLVSNIQSETRDRLKTDVKVLNLALESKKEEALSLATLVSQNSEIKAKLDSREDLGNLLESFLVTKDQSFLLVASWDGEVLGRGEDKSRVGNSISDDSIFKAAKENGNVKSILIEDGAIAPRVFVVAATSIKGEKEGNAIVMTGLILDDAFVDGVKAATGLEASIYSKDQISATTLASLDNKSRLVGLKKSDKILNVPHFVVYEPLKDLSGEILGELSVAKPQISTLQTAGKSIEITFILTAFLILCSIVPAYLISKYLSNQLQ